MLFRWLASLTDRFFAADHGLVRLRYAARAVLAVALAAATLTLLGIPATALLLGCVAAMVCSTSMRAGTPGQRAVNILLFGPAMAASLTLASLLSPYRVLGDVVFVAVMFLAVYIRRFDQLGTSIGMGIFMAYFFATYLHAAPSSLPTMYLSVAIGLISCAIMALLVFRDTPASLLRRTTLSIRAQVARLVDELAELLDDGERRGDAEDVPRSVARQATRLHETTLQIEDNADRLGLDPRWQRELVDAELSADRLARATVRALADDLDQATRADLAEDLRGLHQFVDRDPTPALNLDTDELLRRIARYDIRGNPGLLPSKPEHHTMLVHRAIRELLLSMVRMRRTSTRLLDGESGGAHHQDDPHELTFGNTVIPDRDQDAEEGRDRRKPDQPDPGTNGAAPPATRPPGRPLAALRDLAPSTRGAVQAAIGGALAIMGGELLSAQRWYWAVIAGFIVFAGTHSRGDLLVKGWRRVWGTLLGIIAGTVLGTVLTGHLVLSVVVLLLCIFFAFYTLHVSYATMTFFITIMIGMLYDILGTFSPDVLLLRLAETAIGVTASAIAAMLVLPTRTRTSVLTELHDYFAALCHQLQEARRLLVQAERVSVIAATREVDRAANDVRTAIAPMLYRLSPSRVRRGHATRLLLLTEESSLAARNLAGAAEPGALAGVPEAAETLDRLIANTRVLVDATSGAGAPQAQLVSGPSLAAEADVRELVAAVSPGEPDRVQILHLRRILNNLDRLDKLLLGMAAPLAQTIAVPREHASTLSDLGRRTDVPTLG